ncbi:MAG: hypothetical protein PHG82_04695 [Candidatus Gracilibacteria bacterium]|nr:hypothetical protein [Candidatus Gracilibacteria bacterium]
MKKYILSFVIFLGLFQISPSFADTPSYITQLIKNTDSNYYELNKGFEFTDESGIKNRLASYSCYKIDSSNYPAFTQKGYILKTYDGNYCFAKTINKEKKILYTDASIYFKVLNFSSPVNLENNSYYAYKFTTYFIFQDNEGFYLSNFTKLGYTQDNTIILVKDGKYYIAKDFKKTKLFDASLISGIKDKNKFLSYVYDDIKKSDINTNDIETNLKNIKQITSNFKSTDKTEDAYSWILSNISYFTGDLNDSKNNSIFSGLYTFQNKTGVCDGYTKIFSYLLMFSGIENLEIKTGFVLNSDLFPNFGHAWVKVGDFYYDPTFDDPIGQKTTKTETDYKYFKLPSSILYADRIDGTNISDSIKKSSKALRDLLVSKRFYDVGKKYKNSNYLILKPYITKINLGLKFNEKLDTSKAIKLFSYLEAKNDYSAVDANGNKKYIKNIIYYKVDNSNLENIFAQVFAYNTAGVYLIKWDLGNGQYEYRLSNNIKF